MLHVKLRATLQAVASFEAIKGQSRGIEGNRGAIPVQMKPHVLQVKPSRIRASFKAIEG